MTDRIEIELSADITEIKHLKKAIEGFSRAQQLNTETCFELTLALEEAVANIIEHGELTTGEGCIYLALQVDASSIHVELRDNGRPFNPLQASPPDLEVPFEERAIGGLGIFYLQQMMDELDYRYAEGENLLEMHKRIP